jgi:methyl-accepting chemotaxis protein
VLRKTFIVRPHLQLKYLAVSIALVLLTGVVVYYVFWSTLVAAPGLEQLSSGEWSALQRAYRVSFTWAVLILAAAAGLESIFMFHRLAGPLYVFQKGLKRMGSGDLTAAIHSRRNDELKDLSAQLQQVITNMSSAIEDDRKKVSQITALIDQGKLPEAKETLASITCWYKID